MYDPERYRDKDEVARWKERDPIDGLAARLGAAGLLDDEDLARIEAEVQSEVEDAIAFAEAAEEEAVAELTRFVHSESPR
jgi:pyruvate dehydrogenase E1 component alpha subunit